MKNSIAILILVSFVFKCQAQSEQKFNFGFEKHSNVNKLSDGWFKWGEYELSIDSLSKTGQRSGKITSTENGHFGSIAYRIPANYNGKTIVLEGYMKIRNVKNGFAGLLLRVNGNGRVLAFDNMQKSMISGTRDWQKYKIQLDYPKNAESINIAGILTGKGEAWFDDFVLLIDGKDVQTLKEIDKPIFKASLDKEFDKGSGITNISVGKAQIEDLKVLGLIWGFLKYYHPNIAKGEYNWDYELFRILPKVLNLENKIDRDKILVDWINNLGTYTEGKEIKVKPSEIKLEPDLDWIENYNFSDKLTSLLLNIKNANRPEEHYYIGLKPGVGNPEFNNEDPYPTMKYPDAGFRLLALFRYWNIIQYYFPYKNLIGEDWKNVLEEFIPNFINAKNETEYTLTVLELIGRIHDTHANIWGGNQVLTNYLGNNYAPVEIKFIENKSVVTGYYDEELGRETGLKVGDIISSINNRPVEEIVRKRLKFFPASNYPTKLRNIAHNLLRTNDSTINVEFIRNKRSVGKRIKTYSIKEINIYKNHQAGDTCFKLINKDIAYINNGSLKREYLPVIWEEVENTKGLIIDIRNYPSDFIIYDLSDYLMLDSIPFVKFTNGSIEYPGLFTFTKSFDVGSKNGRYYKGKVIILINEITQSSAEFHAMAYQVHPNATVIGSTTAGADGNVSQFYLPGGINTLISGIGVYYPDGKETQRVGIIPDIEIKPTIKGIKEGRDELMEKAIDLIMENE